MCNGCGGSGLGCERGGDSGGDLSLKGRGGFRHPAKKNVWPGVCVGVGVTVAGVELNNNTALTIRSERRYRRRQNLKKWRKLWLEWNSTTTQHLSNFRETLRK
jgi:hypothetical protein